MYVWIIINEVEKSMVTTIFGLQMVDSQATDGCCATVSRQSANRQPKDNQQYLLGTVLYFLLNT